MILEDYAVIKKPGRIGCEKSLFIGGYHRVGLVPVVSVLDGGMSGCRARWFCLDCGKDQTIRWSKKYGQYFVPIKQPNRLKPADSENK